MTNQELQLFADNYSASDFEKIRSKWNGKYGEEFQDENYDIRMRLCNFLIPQIEQVNIELVNDLFAETTKTLKATFSIYTNIHVYAQELLRRDWKKYLIDYMVGGTYGMDSYLAIGRIELEKEIAQKILDHMNTTIETTEDENERQLITGYLPRFQWLAAK
ncbi:hypothetical protein [Flavihumibacter solisilvae]|uniref:Uncharacterized protein n=1 Tax=Flavihumibacter solisilvae TaxID=1349421 RepID=A0A0C1KTC3_9BACT|nr:hypothetical protein [Flavihumibacter solisilvae]KIC90671.1 hypothetical protein OI18_23220 [Flavihumibacter solisilvae]